MIQLHTDCLVFKTADGAVACPAAEVALELAGDCLAQVDPEIIRNAALGVLHYFKTELGRESVTVAEFSAALTSVLRRFGLEVVASEPDSPSLPRIIERDLRALAHESGPGFELAFFHRLREELRAQLTAPPNVLRFSGLRGCVKQLAGARRWTGRCQELNDQIVEYLRSCLREAPPPPECALVVR